VVLGDDRYIEVVVDRRKVDVEEDTGLVEFGPGSHAPTATGMRRLITSTPISLTGRWVRRRSCTEFLIIAISIRFEENYLYTWEQYTSPQALLLDR
jgi:hypothetical protein